MYEAVRLELDTAWGHGPGTGTLTCYTPVAEVPKNSNGTAVLALRSEFCEYPVARELLPQLLASGAVEEIDEAAYQAAVQPQEP